MVDAEIYTCLLTSVRRKNGIQSKQHYRIGGDYQKGRNSQRKYFEYAFAVVRAKGNAHHIFAEKQHAQRKQCGKQLRKHCRKRSAFNAHSESKYKQRIERNVTDCAYHRSQHSKPRTSLRYNKAVEPCRHQCEKRTRIVYVKIIGSVGKQIARCTEPTQKCVAEQSDDCSKRNGNADEHHKCVGKYPLRTAAVTFTQSDSHKRSAAQTYKIGKGGNYRCERSADSNSPESDFAYSL